MEEFGNAGQDDKVNSAEIEHYIVPAILRPENTDAFINIINKLDALTFANLSKTCHYLHDFVLNTGRVKVPLNCVVDVDFRGNISVWTGDNHGLRYKWYGEMLTPAQTEEIAHRAKNFRIHVEMVCLYEGFTTVEIDDCSYPITNWPFGIATEFLKRIGCHTTERLSLQRVSGIDIIYVPSHDLLQFVKEFGVKVFHSSSFIHDDAVITGLFQNMVSLHMCLSHIPDSVFENRLPLRLNIERCLDFKIIAKVLEGWAKCDFEIDEWKMGLTSYESRTFNISEVLLSQFPSYCIGGPLIRFPLPATRPLILMEFENFSRYLLRSDGLILEIYSPGYPWVCLRQLRTEYLHKKFPMLFPTIGNEDEHKIAPPILCPDYTDALVKIINKLDLFTILKLSKTCHYLYDFCWNAKGIKIPLSCTVHVDSIGCIRVRMEKEKKCNNDQLMTWISTRVLMSKKAQFCCRVDLLCFSNINNYCNLSKAREFLGQIECQRMTTLSLCDGYRPIAKSDEYHSSVKTDELISFIEDFGVKEFSSSTTIEETAIIYLLQNMTSLRLDHGDISKFDLPPKFPPRLHMGQCMRFNILPEILTAWASCNVDIEKWSFASRIHFSDLVDDLRNKIPSSCILNSTFCFPLPPSRPLLIFEERTMKRFSYLMRSDGLILGIDYKIISDEEYDEEYFGTMFLDQLNLAELHKELPMLFPVIENEGHDVE